MGRGRVKASLNAEEPPSRSVRAFGVLALGGVGIKSSNSHSRLLIQNF